MYIETTQEIYMKIACIVFLYSDPEYYGSDISRKISLQIICEVFSVFNE